MSEKCKIIKNEVEKFDESIISDRIYAIRGYQVMLDSDLAELYGVEVRVLNQSVKRNQERFPGEFCFQLTISEVPELRSQIVISNKARNSLRSQMISTKKGGRRFQPYLFTQEGVAMLAGVLKSEVAVKISIQIIKAFIEMRKFIQTNGQMFHRLDRVEVKESKDIHDRFIILDDEIVYHFGASLKDLGRKLFGFTKMDKAGLKLLNKIK